MIDWMPLLKAGHTAIEAAQMMGTSRQAPHMWARAMAAQGVKVQWPGRQKRKYARIAPVISAPCYHAPEAVIQPGVTDRLGGRIVLRNNKTGEVVRKASVQSAYLHANIAGWTDYDWTDAGERP
jgi:hypothetical protein